uniref:Aldehyde dehydrogenase n=1 Tax=Panagrolaimus sp. JU765 TaxID=591449 RepID=A0AC34RGP4_9BILA
MADYSQLVTKLRDSFNDGVMESLQSRRNQLEAFKKMIVDNQDAICDAIWKDLHKARIEVIAHETDFLISEISEAISNLKSWTAPTKVTKYVLQAMDSAYIKHDPLGVVLIIGAWNFPVRLLLAPMVGALAAGNTVVIKPSELSVNISALVAELIPKYLNENVVQVVQGGPAETTELLKERFDHIFYTGNPVVGRIIMRAAAENLTPVTLELGGKNPVIIDSGVDLQAVARRLVWGKFTNAGQICVTADYVLNLNPNKEELLKYMNEAIIEFYGENQKESPDYGRIINLRHFDRISKLLDGTSGDIVHGGDRDRDERYIQPTIVDNVKETDVLMSEEIFGPILPILTVENIESAIAFIKKREKPLSLYIFSTNSANIDMVTNKTSSGGIVINDLIMHLSLETLPFGGVGNSGMGNYHGKYTFDTFTHQKAVLHRPAGFERILFMRYPPYNENKLSWARRFVSKWRVPF